MSEALKQKQSGRPAKEGRSGRGGGRGFHAGRGRVACGSPCRVYLGGLVSF